MNSPDAFADSWIHCREFFVGKVRREPLFTVPLRAVEWAAAHGYNRWLHASRSLDQLVISNRSWQAAKKDWLRVIPKPDGVELVYQFSDGTGRSIAIDETQLESELERVLSRFQPWEKRSSSSETGLGSNG